MFKRETMAPGVPAGATIPHHELASASTIPCSRSVGTSGNNASLRGPLTASVELGRMRATAVSRAAGMEQAKASRGITDLVQMGLVQRVADREGTLLEATESGRAIYAELFPKLADINRRLMAVLDESEADQLARILDKLLAHALALHEEGGGVDARANRRKGGSRLVRAMRRE